MGSFYIFFILYLVFLPTQSMNSCLFTKNQLRLKIVNLLHTLVHKQNFTQKPKCKSLNLSNFYNVIIKPDSTLFKFKRTDLQVPQRNRTMDTVRSALSSSKWWHPSHSWGPNTHWHLYTVSSSLPGFPVESQILCPARKTRSHDRKTL